MMALKPKGIVLRRGKFYRLEINADTNDIDKDGNCLNDVAVFTFTPNTREFEHYHIELEIKQVKRLKKWAEEFLELYS